MSLIKRCIVTNVKSSCFKYFESLSSWRFYKPISRNCSSQTHPTEQPEEYMYIISLPHIIPMKLKETIELFSKKLYSVIKHQEVVLFWCLKNWKIIVCIKYFLPYLLWHFSFKLAILLQTSTAVYVHMLLTIFKILALNKASWMRA